MHRRTGALGILIAAATALPLAGTAHAQDLDCVDFTYQEEAQAVYEATPGDPHRLDEDRGPDDGIACEWLPRRGAATGTSTPSAVTPTLGVRGGLGGSSSSGPSDWETGVGAAFVLGTAGAAGYALRRRRV
ncbi:excalibur calcium-binding domain-containing protein [Streptomyces sp. TRM68416]|uniref:excalibur calcium-binding domain-containing protein n=1 Tax=Streptomyces sp. TRM68416 TaxID=2758412 RepID=UPI001661A47C|nr:excalibur calcium-binding domain-containing protein [Streptomyces sp. TRM68416]MBD0844466.1 excalibur calcium-binding protein [Streptomyces sp. TRM68416]